MNNSKLHRNFKLNGNSFATDDEVLAFSKDKHPELYPFLKDWFGEDSFVKIKTSGSTGNPKILEIKKEHMVNSARATGTFFDLPENTTALLCLSADYIAGKMMLVRALVLGWQIDVVVPSSNPLQEITKHYDFCAMVPLQLDNSLSELHRLKKVIVGGTLVSKVLLEKLQDISTEVFSTYGMTETITHIALKPLNEYAISLRGGTTWQSQNFQTLPNIKISKDARNCLIVNAPKLSDTLIITNDIVELISETEFKWLGRFDNIINSGGIKLIPEQIEIKLSVVIDHRFFVIGVPDEQLGEKMVLIVERQESGIRNQELKFMIESLTSLDKFEIPKGIYSVKEFVETETKKIQRQKTLDSIFM